MFRFNFKAAGVLAAVVAVQILTTTAYAGFMTGFTGNTDMSDSASATGNVSFAVYQNSGADGGNWAAQLGLSNDLASSHIGQLDLTATYVYMYEVVNTGSAASTISLLSIPTSNPSFSSAGWLADGSGNGFAFSDASSQEVGPLANQRLGGAGIPDNDLAGGVEPSPIPSLSGTNVTGFVNDANALTPDASNRGNPHGHAQWSFVANPLGQNNFSTVLFLTSNTAPTYVDSTISSSGTSDGFIPSQAPEPASLVMWGLGLAGFGLVGARRRKRAMAV